MLVLFHGVAHATCFILLVLRAKRHAQNLCVQSDVFVAVVSFFADCKHAL